MRSYEITSMENKKQSPCPELKSPMCNQQKKLQNPMSGVFQILKPGHGCHIFVSSRFFAIFAQNCFTSQRHVQHAACMCVHRQLPWPAGVDFERFVLWSPLPNCAVTTSVFILSAHTEDLRFAFYSLKLGRESRGVSLSCDKHDASSGRHLVSCLCARLDSQVCLDHVVVESSNMFWNLGAFTTSNASSSPATGDVSIVTPKSTRL